MPVCPPLLLPIPDRLGTHCCVSRFSAGMAGRFAARVRAGALVLTHFSPRNLSEDSEADVEGYVEEARKHVLPGTLVLAASDFCTVITTFLLLLLWRERLAPCCFSFPFSLLSIFFSSRGVTFSSP